MRIALLLLLAACSAERPAVRPQTAEASGAREALLAFLAAADAGRFDECYRELAAPLRARYTPERLAEDFRSSREAAKENVARARAAAASDPEGDGRQVSFAIGPGKAVRLIRENGAWRIAALE